MALLFVLAFVLSTAACAATGSPVASSPATVTASAAAESAAPATKAPPVVVTVFYRQGNQIAVKLGVQEDPVAKYIADAIGIQISIYKDGNDGTINEVLATMLASNDLADVQCMGSGNNSSDGVNIEAAVKAGSIIALDDLLKNAPNISASADALARIDFNRKQFVKDGKAYSVGLWSGTGLDSTPVGGPYIRWDLYKQLGYPDVSTNEKLVSALKDMAALEPKTADGQNEYGLGGWFGEAGGWGGWVITNTLPWYKGQAVMNSLCLVDISSSEILPNQLTDTNSTFWSSVDFFYKANHAGILDPDSPTQKMDKYMEKVKAGRYMLISPGWEGRGAKNYMDEIGKKDTAFVCLQSKDTSAVMAWTGFFGNTPYSIAASCKNPEAAMKLLDFLATPAGSRIMSSGIEGQAWTMQDGKPAMTDEVVKDRATMDASAFAEKYGLKYTFFQSLQSNCVNPIDSEYQDLTQSPSYLAKSYNSAEKDAIAHYGAKSITDIYLMNGKPFSYVTEYGSLPELPVELKTEEANIDTYLYGNVFKCVYAKDDADYTMQKQAFIDGLSQFKVADLYQWYVDQYNKNKANLGPQIQPLLDAWNQTVRSR